MEKLETPAAPASEDAFLDENELLSRLPISRRTLANWRTEKGFPHIKVGRRVLYSWSNVSAYLLRKERGGQIA